MKGLVLIYAATVLGSLGALRRPLIGLYVYIAFAVLRPQFIWGWAGGLANISLIVGVAATIGWAINGFGSAQLGRSRPMVVAIAAYLLWNAISGFQAQDPMLSLSAVLELAKTVLPFLMTMTLVQTDSEMRPLLWIVVLGQGYVGFELNLSYYLQGYNAAGIGFGGSDNNFLGATLVAVLGPALTLALMTKRRSMRALAAAAALLILHSTLLTFSRGAMLGLLVLAATAFVIMPKRPTYIAGIVLVALLGLRLTGPQLLERYTSTFVSADERDASSQSRVDLWLDCLKVVQSRPVFGVGPWNWPITAASYGWPAGKSAHSLWMETAAETGVVGAALLLSFFWIAVARLWRLARERLTDANRDDVAIAAGVVLSIVPYCVSAQFVSVGGLEVPYYVCLTGALLLKLRSTTAVEAVSVAREAESMSLSAPLAPARVLPVPATGFTRRPRLLPRLPARRA